MGRKKLGITEKNFHEIDIYFSNWVQANRSLGEKSLENINKLYDAKASYKSLPVINWKNEKTIELSTKERRAALQKWADEFVTPARWERCLKTLRQNKSRKNEKN